MAQNRKMLMDYLLKGSLLLLSSFVLLFFSGCASQRSISEIKFGESGGIAGGTTEYLIKPNGDVFVSKTLSKEKTKIKTLDKASIKKVQDKFNKLSNESKAFNYTWNIYYFMEAKNGSERIRIVWGDPQHPETSEIKDLYAELQKLISK